MLEDVWTLTDIFCSSESIHPVLVYQEVFTLTGGPTFELKASECLQIILKTSHLWKTLQEFWLKAFLTILLCFNSRLQVLLISLFGFIKERKTYKGLRIHWKMDKSKNEKNKTENQSLLVTFASTELFKKKKTIWRQTRVSTMDMRSCRLSCKKAVE